jgi:hypothetical protein
MRPYERTGKKGPGTALLLLHLIAKQAISHVLLLEGALWHPIASLQCFGIFILPGQ